MFFEVFKFLIYRWVNNAVNCQLVASSAINLRQIELNILKIHENF